MSQARPADLLSVRWSHREPGESILAPLARAVLGGLAASTLIALPLIPAVYSLFYPQSTPRAVPEAASGETA